ncbi:MAG TPA: glutaredoxin 3 [Myxococcaceae bacterium]|nr:glutaredoxin 3 [Myxococcaceae bacterium]
MKPVKIYTASYCGYCDRAKDFLRRKGVAFDEVDVTGDDEMRAKLVEMTGRRTVPQIFVGEEAIGGYSDMVALEQQGKLDPKLQA